MSQQQPVERGQQQPALDEVFAGILWKKHRKNQFWSGWHNRFFVLHRNGRLSYYKNSKRIGKPRGGVHLNGHARVVVGTKSSRHNFYRFEVYTSNGQVVLLAGDDEEYTTRWVDMLQHVIQSPDAGGDGSGMEVDDVSDDPDESMEYPQTDEEDILLPAPQGGAATEDERGQRSLSGEVPSSPSSLLSLHNSSSTSRGAARACK